jgi:hypothetical protein
MAIAQEGHVPVAVCVLAAAAVAYPLGVLWAGPLLALAAVFTWTYRSLPANTPAAPLTGVSPATGLVQSAGPKRDPWLDNRDCLRVVTRLPKPGVVALRAPLEGKVMDFWVRGGVRKSEQAEGGSPTCYTLWIQTDEGDDIVVAVHGLRGVSRFRSNVAPGERIGHGQQLGFIYFGTVVSTYLPANADCNTSPGAQVVGGTTPIGTLTRP